MPLTLEVLISKLKRYKMIKINETPRAENWASEGGSLTPTLGVGIDKVP